MLLRNITLHDFGAYRGEQSLDLTTEKGRPIVLIGGLNGCGKTTLLDAIQLALYGNRARCSGRGNSSYDTYLRESINRLADPEDGARVAVEFSILLEGEEHRYHVSRSWRIPAGKKLDESLEITVNGKPEWGLSEGWVDHIEGLLPLEVASLFFFDGEKLEELADPDQASNIIRSAVHSLLGVSGVERLRTDLLVLERRIQTSAADEGSQAKIAALGAELEELASAIGDAVQRRGSLNNRLKAAMYRAEQARVRFAKEGGEVFRRFATLKAENDGVAATLKATNDTLVNTVAAGPLPLLLLREQLDTVREHAQREHRADQAAEVLSVLRERDSWLTDLFRDATGPDQIARIEKELSADREERDAQARAPRELNVPHDMLAQLSALDDTLSRDRTLAVELVERAIKEQARFDATDRLLASKPEDEDEIRSLMDAQSAALDAVSVLRAEQARIETDLEELRARHRGQDAELERELRKQKLHDKVDKMEARVKEYSASTRGILERYAAALLTRHIGRLEVAVLDSFSKLMRKKNLVADLHIDTKDFSLALTGSDGQPLESGRLSAGERQLLALSLLWGVARVAGNRLPSVIDTPLGRLDSKHREQLVERYFPHAGDQVLLLSTDEEIDERLFHKLESSIARSYTLTHDNETFTTSVRQGYLWPTGETHVA
ncbi:DNA sulfur modification protein DndD [Embleya scabrispora]|uniref:DNA sulfur modification protein DndD n=1 Tax=Embleya scabrispora TaxID=159449 RepID=UPI000371CC21|nr:DNA sulfur modification protein DndD [Embleya scabrispora]MYS87884.1 DNA sulfur modification protein DndD [Streptomyces sp. SID5474]